MGFLFAFVTLALGFVILFFAVEVIPSLPVARFLRWCLVPIFFLGSLNRCFETWELVASGFVMAGTDVATFVSRSLQLALFAYGSLRYLREGPSGAGKSQNIADDIYSEDVPDRGLLRDP